VTHGQTPSGRRQTYGYLPNLGASPLFGRYQIILLGEQRHMCVNNLPNVATWQCLRSESIRGPFGHQCGPLPLYEATLKVS